jgi:hypothetical protein
MLCPDALLFVRVRLACLHPAAVRCSLLPPSGAAQRTSRSSGRLCIPSNADRGPHWLWPQPLHACSDSGAQQQRERRSSWASCGGAQQGSSNSGWSGSIAGQRQQRWLRGAVKAWRPGRPVGCAVRGEGQGWLCDCEARQLVLWSYDGSSTGQAKGNNSDCILK